MRLALTRTGKAIRYAAEELRANKEVVLAAVSQDGHALQYASEELRDDQDIVFRAVTQNASSLKWASSKLQSLLSSDENEAVEEHEQEATASANQPQRVVGSKRPRSPRSSPSAETSSTSKLSKQARIERGSVSTTVKQEVDGGWPSEFQALRQQPFDQADYARLHAWFFTPYDVHAGSNQSVTRRGTLRSTLRVVRQNVRVAEWPRLQEHVERLIAEGQRHKALGHLRCLAWYMQKALHATIPRILRAAPAVPGGRPASEQSVVEEPIELLDSSSEEEEKDMIDVESVILGPLEVHVKAEPT